MSRLRARVAERLLQSQASNAILTTFNEVNMGPVMALRKQYGDRFEKAHGVRLGFMGFFVKAAGVLLFYGGMLGGIAPARDGVSWESHLFGLLVGGGLAWLV